ncbi:MAG: hypothetical protein WDN29_09810 [Methylovirgula sp.]
MFYSPPDQKLKRRTLIIGFAKFIGICAFIFFVGWALYRWALPTYCLRYRLTLVLTSRASTTPDRAFSNSNISLSRTGSSWGSGVRFWGEMHGNAPTVDLADRGLLFVVYILPSADTTSCLPRFQGNTLGTLPLKAFGFPEDGPRAMMAGIVEKLQRDQRSINVPLAILPMLVHFKDLRNESTIEQVDPCDLVHRLRAGRLFEARNAGNHKRFLLLKFQKRGQFGLWMTKITFTGGGLGAGFTLPVEYFRGWSPRY